MKTKDKIKEFIETLYICVGDKVYRFRDGGVKVCQDKDGTLRQYWEPDLFKREI